MNEPIVRDGVTATPAAPAGRFNGPAQLAVAAALHLILIVAVVQAWMTGWPGKIWLTIGALLAIAASAALFRRARGAPLIIGALAIAAVFLWAALWFGSDAGGLRIAGVPFGTATAAVIVVALIIAAWQLWKLASSPRFPRWARFIPAAIALYAVALIMLAIARGASPSGAISGEGPLPWYVSGPYLGSAVLLPLGLIVSLAVLALAVARRRSGVLATAAVAVVMLSAFVLSGLELTRNSRPNLSQFIIPASFASAGPSSGSQYAASGTSGSTGALALGAHEGSLAPYEGKDIDEIFARVATGVRYEPYSGILRGPIGTAIARSGNALDQSMLLAEVLRRAGYRVRYARGTLTDENINAVIAGMYPPAYSLEKVPAEYSPYDPGADSDLRTLVRDHMWVEVFQGESWLPLDPSFPRAKIGETYAQGSDQFDVPAESLFQRVEATLKEETENGRSRDLGTFAGTVAELGMKPISLVVRAIPQSTGGDVEAQPMGGTAAATGGMGDALGGATEAPKPEPPKKTPEQIVGVAHVREMSAGGSPQKLQRTTVRNGDTGSGIRREWIEFNLTGPANQSRRIERVLYQADEKTKSPAAERRYTISILPGRIPRSFADEQTALASSLVNVKEIEQRAKRVGNISPDDPKAPAAAAELGQMGDAVGTVAGHLLALRFAAESDSLSRRIADGTGVALAWATPRILIVGIEMTEKSKGQMDAKVSLDLRLDEVRAYPYPAAPSQIVSVFQMARGVQESVIEGRLVALATGRNPSANTAELVAVAQKQGVPLVVINTSTRSTLGQLAPGVPATCVQMMDAALAKGREIVLPSRAIALGGEQRWGWWEVDPASGAVVGVMQNGEHQGMAEYSVNSATIGLNDKSGMILGAMMGAITTVGTLSAMILEYGSVTPELIKALEEFMKQLACNSCIDEAGVKIESGAELKHDCFKIEAPGKIEVGVGVKVGYCKSYLKGFNCASGMILRALKNEPMLKMKEEVKFLEAEAKIGCTDVGK